MNAEGAKNSVPFINIKAGHLAMTMHALGLENKREQKEKKKKKKEGKKVCVA